jgi:hypothetical protein
VARATAAQADLRHRPFRRTAALVEHLIPTARLVPLARLRRRADAADVIAAYRATIEKLKALNQQPR